MKRTWDLVGLGGGSAGLVASLTAAGLGARVALIEADRPGGDCLYTGCVPSKSLIASARLAHDIRHAGGLGLDSIDALELVVSLEKKFGVSVPNSETARLALATVNSIHEYVVANRKI